MKDIEKFLKDNLDNVYAFVNTEGLRVEGYHEQKCKINFNQYNGLQLSVNIKHNISKHITNVQRFIIDNIDNLTYVQRDKILDTLLPAMENMFFHVGTINYYGIINISTVYKDEILTSVTLVYKNGNVINIKCIEKIVNN